MYTYLYVHMYTLRTASIEQLSGEEESGKREEIEKS